jgi:hypothetical protein
MRGLRMRVLRKRDLIADLHCLLIWFGRRESNHGLHGLHGFRHKKRQYKDKN